MHGGPQVTDGIDFAWAAAWMADHPELEECSSARVVIDGITHRALNEGAGWRTLCKSHVLMIRGGQFTNGMGRWFDLSTASADCLCCLPAGG